MKRRSGGFTLIELLAVFLCCSLITLAAMTLLLMSVRVEARTESAVSRRMTAHIVLTELEKLAGSGKVKSVEKAGGDWILLGEDNVPLLQYTSMDGTLISGAGAVLMDGLEDARAELNDETQLLSFSLRTSEETAYTTSVYCRMGVTLKSYADADELLAQVRDELEPEEAVINGEAAGRLALLTVLAGEYGSGGEIQNGDGVYRYYSEWYIHGYQENPGWNENTPWCACFVSWAAAQIGEEYLTAVPRFSSVSSGVAQFKGEAGGWKESAGASTPGDFIFFDWERDGQPDHVGVVFYVDSERGTVYTIEGNSGGRVALRVYSMSDPRIIGCGVLAWEDGAMP